MEHSLFLYLTYYTSHRRQLGKTLAMQSGRAGVPVGEIRTILAWHISEYFMHKFVSRSKFFKYEH